MDSYSLETVRKTLIHFSLCNNKKFGQVFEFSERNRLFPLQAGKSSEITVSHNQGNNRHGSQHLINETVLPEDFLATSGNKSVSFRKIKYLTKAVVVMRRKMYQCVCQV